VGKRQSPRGGFAQPVGAVLIALALLMGVSLVPQQTAVVPTWIAARLGQGFGLGVDLVPVLCLFLGVIFFMRGRFQLSPRVLGVLVGYAVALVALHVRYPAGYEWIAASGRKGGGYAGGALTAALRRAVGEPGLWTAMVLGAGLAVMLLSGTSFTDVLRGLLGFARALAGAVAGMVRRAAASLAGACAAALRLTTTVGGREQEDRQPGGEGGSAYRPVVRRPPHSDAGYGNF
jgi:hypothetical protein